MARAEINSGFNGWLPAELLNGASQNLLHVPRVSGGLAGCEPRTWEAALGPGRPGLQSPARNGWRGRELAGSQPEGKFISSFIYEMFWLPILAQGKSRQLTILKKIKL